MRFLLYDRVLELKKGDLVRGVKAITLSEDTFSEAVAGVRYLPETLVTEALAQIAGWLINVTRDFQSTSLMSMVRNAQFHSRARAGDLLILEAQIIRLEKDVGLARATASIGDRAVATIEEILFVLMPVPAAQAATERRKFDYFSGNYRGEWT